MDIKFKFYKDFGSEILEVQDPQTGEIETVSNPVQIDEFLEWNLTDVYVYEWTDGEDVLGLFS